MAASVSLAARLLRISSRWNAESFDGRASLIFSL
jgi:hypothetical protein